MNYKLTKQLKNHPQYSIHIAGFVSKLIPGRNKDITLQNIVDETNQNVYVEIAGEKKNLLYLMIENFMPTIKLTQEIKYSIQFNQNNQIPLESIKVSGFVSDISDKTMETIAKFNCRGRSESANKRSNGLITPVHVAECLQAFKFQCVYCSTQLNAKNWHLDHFIPLSRGGQNAFINLVPSCGVCNLMKGALAPKIFYNKCKAIYNNYLFKQEGAE